MCLCLPQGQSGNAVQYLSRNQALKKLQLKLSEFRRLCILKGIHPREPKKKPQARAAVGSTGGTCLPVGCLPAARGCRSCRFSPPSLLSALAPPRHTSLTHTTPALQGQHKTYYHAKDVAYLLHEPLLKKARELHAYEKKVRGARGGRGRGRGSGLWVPASRRWC